MTTTLHGQRDFADLMKKLMWKVYPELHFMGSESSQQSSYEDLSQRKPLSMKFSGQEYWSGLPFPPPGDLPDPGTETVSPAWQVDSLPLSHLESPVITEAEIGTMQWK